MKPELINYAKINTASLCL